MISLLSRSLHVSRLPRAAQSGAGSAGVCEPKYRVENERDRAERAGMFGGVMSVP
jgi:hypothetical protein